MNEPPCPPSPKNHDAHAHDNAERIRQRLPGQAVREDASMSESRTCGCVCR
jgi:hypothetical protein